MTEKDIEQRFRLQCKLHGCHAVKFIDPSRDGAPDRFVLTPWGMSLFVEFKKPGEQPRRNQIQYLLMLNEMGYLAFTANDSDTPLNLILMLQASSDRSELYRSLCQGQIKALNKL